MVEKIELEGKEFPTVKLEEPFTITPNFQKIEVAGKDLIEIYIENVGKAEITVYRDSLLEEDIQQAFENPIKTPAGPVQFKVMTDENDEIKAVVPPLIGVEIEKLNKRELESLKCDLIFKDLKFEGKPHYDSIELVQEKKASLNFDSWIDPQTKKAYDLFFPPDPEIFKNIKFVFRKGNKPSVLVQ